jgi:hypothetical protein
MRPCIHRLFEFGQLAIKDCNLAAEAAAIKNALLKIPGQQKFIFLLFFFMSNQCYR